MHFKFSLVSVHIFLELSSIFRGKRRKEFQHIPRTGAAYVWRVHWSWCCGVGLGCGGCLGCGVTVECKNRGATSTTMSALNTLAAASGLFDFFLLNFYCFQSAVETFCGWSCQSPKLQSSQRRDLNGSALTLWLVLRAADRGDAFFHFEMIFQLFSRYS